MAIVDHDKPWAFYKDLDKIWEDEFCGDLFTMENTLILDSDDTKIQLHKECSLITEPYEVDDV